MRYRPISCWILFPLLVLGCEGTLIDRHLPVTPPPPPPSAPSLALRLGGTGTDIITDLLADPTGNLYVAGTFTGTLDFDPGTGVTSLTSLGLADVFVAKYSSTGTLAWVARIGGTSAERVTALSRDPAGNLLLAGAFEGSTDFDPGPGLQVLTSLGGEDGFVVKLSPGGAFVWARRFGGPNADGINAVATDAAGRVYVAGDFLGTANTLPIQGASLVTNGSAADGFLIGFDGSGTVGFAFRLGGPDADFANAVTVTTSGVVVVGGAFRGTAILSGGSSGQLVAQGTDAFLAGYSSTGALQWARDLGGSGDEAIRIGGLAADAQGGVVATGTFTGTPDFDAGAAVEARTSQGGTDWFAVHYDGAGLFSSVFAVGSAAPENAPRPAVDLEGNLLLAGSFSGSLDFDPGIGTTILTSLGSAGATDAFTARYTMAGALLWVSRFGEGTSVSERQNQANAVAASSLGSILVAGQFFGSPDFDPGSSAFRLTSLGGADAFVIQLTSAGGLTITP